MRIVRRLLTRYFGSTKNFIIWTLAVIFTVFVIDNYVLTPERIEAFVSGRGTGIVQPGDIKSTNAPVLTPTLEAKVDGQNKEPVKSEVKDNCGVKETCPPGKFSFYVKSGEGRASSPVICFNSNYAIKQDEKNNHRGLHVVIINEKTGTVEDVKYFDTYSEDNALIKYLKLGVADHRLILAASQDEMTTRLSDDGKDWLRAFGSAMITRVQFRDSFVLMGQRGLTSGSAIEKIGSKGAEEFAAAVEISGCVAVPMGRLKPVEVKPDKPEEPIPVKVGEEMANCGVQNDCGPAAFPVHVYSGKGNSEGPKICVNGK